MRVLLGIVIAGLLGALAWVPSPAPAQTDDERVREHEERVRAIIEQRRRDRQQAAGGQTATPTPAPAADEGPVRLGTVILQVAFRVEGEAGKWELDTVVREGDRFVSDIIIRNEASASFDRVRLGLKYDRRFVRPLGIFDDELRTSSDPEPHFEINQRDNIIVYDAQLNRVRVAKDFPVLKIVWEALRPTEHTGLNFVFASGETERGTHTGVYQGSRNILGRPDDPFDGVLGGAILIMRPFSIEDTRPEIVQGKREELRRMYLETIDSNTVAGLRLVGPEGPFAVGDTFDVDVQIFNPNGAIIDSVKFYLEFDPEVLEVIDTDRGNWIRRGVNIHDGIFRLNYPFDIHQRNQVDNTRGRIYYAMANTDGLAMPTGTFARITFRAKQPTAETEMELIAGRSGAANLTALQTFGFNLLTTHPTYTTPVFRATILPERGDVREYLAAIAGTEDRAEIPRDAGGLPANLFHPVMFPMRGGMPEATPAPESPSE